MWCTLRRPSGKNTHKTDAFLTGKFFRSRAEAMTISPDLCLVTRTKHEAGARVPTREVTQHATHSRETLRGLPSDPSRHFARDGFIELSRGYSRTALPPRRKGGILDVGSQVKSSKRADVQDAFLTGEFFRSRAEVFSEQERKKFPPNTIQRKRSRELRCSGLLVFFSFGEYAGAAPGALEPVSTRPPSKTPANSAAGEGKRWQISAPALRRLPQAGYSLHRLH